MAAFAADSLAARLLAALPPSRVTRQRVAKGGAVFRQGDPVSAIFLVESGCIRLARMQADGTALVLQVAEAGDSFAEAALSAAAYHCDAMAEADSVVLALPKSDLLAALAADPAECLALTLALASQVRDLRARLELRNVRPASERVLAWLQLHASGQSPCVALRHSWTRAAEEMGLTREAVYRALARLEEQARIVRSPGMVCLTDQRRTSVGGSGIRAGPVRRRYWSFPAAPAGMSSAILARAAWSRMTTRMRPP